jgi:hypothetical protein
MTVAELIAELRRLPPNQMVRWRHYGIDGVTAGDLITELEAADPVTRLHGSIELGLLPPLKQDSLDWQQSAPEVLRGTAAAAPPSVTNDPVAALRARRWNGPAPVPRRPRCTIPTLRAKRVVARRNEVSEPGPYRVSHGPSAIP